MGSTDDHPWAQEAPRAFVHFRYFFPSEERVKNFPQIFKRVMSTLPALPNPTHFKKTKKNAGWKLPARAPLPSFTSVPHAGGVDFHRPRPSTLLSFLPTSPHTYIHAIHTHAPPPPRPPHALTAYTCLPTHAPHARVTVLQTHSPKIATCTRVPPPRVPPHTGAFHSCASEPRLHTHRLGSLSPLSFLGRAWGDWRPDPPRSSASRAVRSLPGALSSPRLSTWPASPTGPWHLCSRPRKHRAGCGTSQVPPPEPSDSGESGRSVEGNPLDFPSFRTEWAVGATGCGRRRCPSPLRKMLT